jgi:hypothetical protein
MSGKGVAHAERFNQVQCQRTRLFIPLSPSDSLAICPWCKEQETYRRLGPEHEAWSHVVFATHICRAEFGIADDGREVAIWLGEGPETVFERHLDRYNIYLGRDSDRWQFMYSGAHEAFHRVCGEGKNSSHWLDEMFAVMFSLLYLEFIGEAEHAERNRVGLIEQSELLSRSSMFAVTEGPLPDGLYGQAYVTGEELREKVGWDAMRLLAVTRTPEGHPDVEERLNSLLPDARARAEKVLS